MPLCDETWPMNESEAHHRLTAILAADVWPGSPFGGNFRDYGTVTAYPP
jgi:hypothetical protein